MKINPTQAEKFLRAFAETGKEIDACQAAGFTRYEFIQWKNRDEDFGKQVEEAKACIASILRDEAYRRAVLGVDEPIYQQGMEVGRVRKYSDTLLSQLLKANDPAFRDSNRLELANADDKPFKIDDKDAASRLREILAAAEERRKAEAAGKPNKDAPPEDTTGGLL